MQKPDISPRSFGMRSASLGALAVAAIAGCAHQPPEYAWSHAASGEYLFTFDVRECTDLARSESHRTGAAAPDRTPAFFACMTERGYFLVDPATGLALADRQLPPPSGSPQAARPADRQPL